MYMAKEENGDPKDQKKNFQLALIKNLWPISLSFLSFPSESHFSLSPFYLLCLIKFLPIENFSDLQKMTSTNWPHLLSFLLLLIILLLFCSVASLICWLTFSANSSSSSFFSSSTSKSNNNSSIAIQPQFLLQRQNQSKMDTAAARLSQNGSEFVANGVMVVSHPHQLNGISLTNGHSERKTEGMKNGFHHPLLMNGGYSNRLRNAYLNGNAIGGEAKTNNDNANGELTNGNSIVYHNGHSKDVPIGFLPNSIPQPIRLPHRRLRIAQVAPLYESVPPKMYGGTERVVAHLTEELVCRGHEVTLFCSSDSQSSAKMVFHESWPAFRLNPVLDVAIPYQWMMEQIRRRANEFDILHFHTMEHFTIVNQFMNRSVTTLHGLLSFPDMETLLKLFNFVPLVSISNDQRNHLKTNPNWVGTVHHGIPRNLFPFTERPQGEKPYLAFLGRITDVKRPEWAIQIAVKAGIPLRIAAKMDKVDVQHWEEKVKPLIEENSNLVEYIGEINDLQKGAFLGNALALLFPIDWNEPFGLVMIESLACGTPVIARKCGSVSEVIDDGLSGIIFETIEEGVEAVKRVHQLNRAKVRETFERRFTSEKMAENYLNIYEKMLGNKIDDE